MPKINRSKTVYKKLPEGLKTASIPDAKMAASITLTVPKGMEKKAEKFIAEAQKNLEAGFQSFVKKEIKKYENRSEDD